MPLFEATDITVTFGAVHALSGFSLDVEAGEIAGLIGPNGAGKTTFVDAVTGYVRTSGTVRLDGKLIDGLAPHRRAQAGLARTWQNAELFDDLTVIDNVRLVEERLRPGLLLRNLFTSRRAAVSYRVHGILELLGIAAFADSSPRELSVGQRKLVGLARALASDAKVVLMDEPAAGLDSSETQALKTLLRSVADDGVAVLLIEHDMDLVLSVSETLHVLNMGQPVASGPAATVRTDPEVIRAYLGTDDDPGAAEPLVAELEATS